MSERTAKVLAVVFLVTTLAGAAGMGWTWWYIRRLTLTLPVPQPPVVEQQPKTVAERRVSPLLLQYQLDVPGRGEIFPTLAAASPADYWPVALLTIGNGGDEPVIQIVHAEIPGWSRPLRQSIVVGPRQTVGLRIEPELLPSAYDIPEIERATLNVAVSNEVGATSFAQRRPVLIHSGSDLYWGKQFSNAQLVARWVTPHDESVLKLVSSARRFVPNGRMPGYNINPQRSQALPAQVRMQAEAVFKALKDSGFSYVSTIYTFGGFTSASQRIRMPRETLTLDSANCMDISVAYASAIENLGMQPVLVIIPGHAFVGVRLGPSAVDVLYLDLTVLPKGNFAQAITRAQRYLKKTPTDQVLTVDVAVARRMGIYPLPAGQEPPQTPTPPLRSQVQ